MIKNKHGFTLIEVIGIITILSLMLLVAIPSITKTLKRNEQKKYDDYINNLKVATESYIVEILKNGETVADEYYVTLGKLIDKKYIQESIKNPENGGTLSRETKIKVTKNLIGVRDYTVEPHYLLPESYTSVDYIASTGTQYIDLKYAYKINDEINISFMKTQDTGAIQGIFGNGNISTYTGTVLYINGSNILTSTIGGVLGLDFFKYETQILNNVKHNVKYEGKNVYLDDKLKISVQNDLKNGTQEDFSLFRRWGTNGFYGRIYDFSVKRNNEVIFDFVPCYRNSDHEVGMFDLVNFVFYTNKGTGTFEYGNE